MIVSFVLQGLLLHGIPYITLFFGVFIVSLYIIPKIREISLRNQLIDSSSHRSSHMGNVPTFGRVAFYISYILVLFFSRNLDEHHVSLTLLASISIVFFTGLLDDLKNLSPKLKFLGQLLAVGLLMIQPDFTGSLLVLLLMLFLAIFILFLMNKNKAVIRIE